MIKRIKEVLVMDNGFFKVYNDKVLFNGKTEGEYFRQSLSDKYPNFGVIAICEYEDKIILLENFRYAHQKFQIETVKGMGMKGKTPRETILIEVNEEIGGIVESIDDLGLIMTDISDTDIFLFKIKLSGFTETKHEETEVIQNIALYSEDEVNELIKSGKIEDSGTLSAILRFRLQL